MLPTTNITYRNLWKNNKGFILFFLLMVGFRTGIADWNVVPSGSMQPTILPGDRIWINKLAYDAKIPFTEISLYQFEQPKRGDIIVFNSKKADIRLIKRVMGLPGDRLSMQDNQLYINDTLASYLPLNKPAPQDNATYANEVIAGISHAIKLTTNQPSALSTFPTITVPKGHYFVLGDNRDNSLDSRYYGFVPHEEIIGRSQRVILSLNYDQYYLPRKERFFQKMN